MTANPTSPLVPTPSESDESLFCSRVAKSLASFRAGLSNDNLHLLRDDTTGQLRMARWMVKNIEQIVDRALPDPCNDLRLGTEVGRWEAVAAAAGWGELSGEVGRIITNMVG